MPRPVHLHLLRIRQPVAAVVSILHRASGVALFLLLPFLLSTFERSLTDEAHFQALRADGGTRVLLLVVFAFYAYHLVAGVRFLLFDTHRAGLYRHARSSAWLVLLLAAGMVAALGAWLC